MRLRSTTARSFSRVRSSCAAVSTTARNTGPISSSAQAPSTARTSRVPNSARGVAHVAATVSSHLAGGSVAASSRRSLEPK